jgi:hypothetical protein
MNLGPESVIAASRNLAVWMLDGTTRIIQDLRICLRMQSLDAYQPGRAYTKWRKLPRGQAFRREYRNLRDDVSYIPESTMMSR